MGQDEDVKSDEKTVSAEENKQEGNVLTAKKIPTAEGRHLSSSSFYVAKSNDHDRSDEKNPINSQGKEEFVEPVQEEVCSVEPSESLINGDQGNSSYETFARASSSQRDFRQQFRLLRSQELIQRILQSTGVLPNNLAQKRRLVDHQSAKCEGRHDNIDTQKKSRENLININQNPISENSKNADTKEQRLRDFCGNPLESEKSEKVKESRREGKKEMESDTSFVCSVCSCKQHETSELKEKDLNTSLDTSSVATVEQEPKLCSTKELPTAKIPSTHSSKVNSTEIPNVEELSERLHRQPSHEMLDEILRLLQNQARQIGKMEGEKDENDNNLQSALKTPGVGVRQANKQPLEMLMQDESTMEGEWKQEQQQKYLMMRTKTNLREKHSRQLTDMKNYYENEIGKLRNQLENLRGNLSSLQEAIPMKMLESANEKLEGRCQLMEQINNELKGKCVKLDQVNEELDKSSHQLRQNNEALEMKCMFLQNSLKDSDGKFGELRNKNKVLESKLNHLTKVNDVNAKNHKQLEEVNKTLEKACKELEQTNEKLEVRYKKCKEENLQLSADMRDLQGSLQTSRKYAQEQESLAAALQKEKNDWEMKLELAQKTAKGAQSRYEEIKVQRDEQMTMIENMEEQMAILTASCETAAKAKSEYDKNAERDRELLKRLLTEYDALVKENQKLKDAVTSTTSKFDLSQDEMNDLRGTISTLIHRNASLEESLKESLYRSAKSTPESTSSPRKTWDSSLAFKAAQQLTNSDFESIFDGRSVAIDSLTAEKDHFVDTEEIPQKDQPSTPPSIKFEIPWERPKSSTPSKNSSKRNLEQSYNRQIKSPNNLVIKKSDLVTRFDVVFEDSESGAEVKRSHTGHTSRSQGESPTSIFVSNSVADMNESSPNRLVSNAAEAALSALKSGRVIAQGDWEGRDSKSIQQRKKSTDKKKIRQSKSAGSFEEKSDQESEVSKLERKFSTLTEEKLRLESTLSRIPTHRVTKRSKDDKAFLEKRLDEVIQDIGSVRMQLRKYHAL